MTTIKNTSADASHSIGRLIKTRWLNPRRKRFWAMMVVLLYTLLGFFAAPLVLRNSVIALLQEDLGRPTQIESIQVNPFMLSLRVQGLEIRDTDGVKLAAFDGFFVNFQLASLLKWAWTFSQVELTGPYFHFERFDTGDSRLDRLLADFERSQPIEPLDSKEAEKESGVPRVLIRNLGIIEGQVDTRDNVPETPVDLQLTSINISIQELNTIPDHDGQQTVTISLPDDASLKWSGNLDFVPLNSKGELVLEGLHLDRAIAYLEPVLPLESIHAVLSSSLQYHLRQDNTGELKLDVDGLDITLDDLLLNGLTPSTKFVDIPRISLLGGKLRYPEQSLQFSKLSIESPGITAWINEDGSISMMDLIPDDDAQTQTTDIDSPALPWQLGIGEFALENGSLALTDKSTQPNASINLAQLQLKVSGISNGDQVLMPFELAGELHEGGSYLVKGDMAVLPGFSISANASTRDIPLSLGQTYVQQFAQIAVENGVLNSELELNLPAGDGIELSGSLQIPGLEVSDTLDNERLLAWNELDVDRFDLNAGGLQFSQLTFKQPFGRIVIHEDLSTNLAALMVEQETDTNNQPDAQPMNFTIGGIRIEDGDMDFADFSLPLPFATHITNLGGSISTIATDSTEPANIRLEGQVDEYGLARIDGSMNVLDPVQHTDIMVEFRNLMMSNMSPYTVAFAGRKIEKGKLDLGLVYAIDEGQLNGANDVVLSELELGEKVDHPDAASLPLGLAVSLLKDADGVIRIDLPVEGDINDPEFKIGGVVWKAFAGMITKIVAAPFKLLGKLIGVDSEDFGQFEFLAGRADLTPPELEKIVQLEQALQQRPELIVEISGVTSRAIDVPALKYIRMRNIANERLDEGLGDQVNDNMMLDEEIRAVVEALFTERFPDIPPQSLKAAHSAPPADDPEGKPVLDELAWAVDMWERLLAAEVITDQDLSDLASARAQAIKAGFVANGQVDGNRIVIAEPKEVESEDGEWVKLELAVISN